MDCKKREEIEDIRVYLYVRADRILNKWHEITEHVYYFTIEELVSELYTINVSLSTLANLLVQYRHSLDGIFLHGFESMDEAYAKKLKETDMKRRNAIRAWMTEEAKSHQEFKKEDSLYPIGYHLAELMEDKTIKEDLEEEDKSPADERLAKNMESMARLMRSGLLKKDFEEAGFDYRDMLSDELNVKILSEKIIGIEGMCDKICRLHFSIVEHFMVHLYMADYLMDYVQSAFSQLGWNRLADLDKSEALKFFENGQSDYEASKAYKEKRDSLFAEDLLDDGEPIAEKILVFRSQFKNSQKTYKMVKQYRLMKENIDDVVDYIIHNRVNATEVENLYYYRAILRETDKYEANAKLKGLTNGMNAKQINIFLGDQVGTKEINVDKNFGSLIDNHDGGIIAKPETKGLTDGTKS